MCRDSSVDISSSSNIVCVFQCFGGSLVQQHITVLLYVIQVVSFLIAFLIDLSGRKDDFLMFLDVHIHYVQKVQVPTYLFYVYNRAGLIFESRPKDTLYRGKDICPYKFRLTYLNVKLYYLIAYYLNFGSFFHHSTSVQPCKTTRLDAVARRRQQQWPSSCCTCEKTAMASVFS